MDAKKALQLVRDEVVRARDEHTVTAIVPDSLIALLDDLAKRVDVEEPYDGVCKEFLLIDAEHRNTSYLDMFRSVIAAGQNALKAALIVSGGSAAAILAFAGSAWSALKPDGVHLLACSLAFLSFALLMSVIATGFNYLTQYAFKDGLYKGREHPRNIQGHRFNYASLALIAAAYLLIYSGYVCAFLMLGEFNIVRAFSVRP